MDPKLTLFIKQKLGVTYGISASLCDLLVRSHYSSPGVDRWCSRIGTFHCGSCNVCNYLSHGASSVSGKLWTCAHFVDCATQGVMDLWLCGCGSYYIGKTAQAFRINIMEHLYAANICDPLSPIGRHRAIQHGYRPTQMSFTVLDHIHPNQ